MVLVEFLHLRIIPKATRIMLWLRITCKYRMVTWNWTLQNWSSHLQIGNFITTTCGFMMAWMLQRCFWQDTETRPSKTCLLLFLQATLWPLYSHLQTLTRKKAHFDLRQYLLEKHKVGKNYCYRPVPYRQLTKLRGPPYTMDINYGLELLVGCYALFSCLDIVPRD